MMRLISGCNELRLYRDVNVCCDDRFCQFCQLCEVEDLFHLVMSCTTYYEIRSEFFQDIENVLSPASVYNFLILPKSMKFLLIMGLEFPYGDSELLNFRKLAVYYVNKMYRKRLFISILT